MMLLFITIRAGALPSSMEDLHQPDSQDPEGEDEPLRPCLQGHPTRVDLPRPLPQVLAVDARQKTRLPCLPVLHC